MPALTPVITNAEFPAKLQPLFSPKRFKVLHGGRGGTKSWGVARALLITGVNAQFRPDKVFRVLCARELQKSIKQSVHKLISDQIKRLRLEAYFIIQDASIKGKPGTSAEGCEFFFEGLRLNAEQIKSYEDVDVCWVEEAQAVSYSSWQYLIPTIRKAGSEIWITFNPKLKTDDTYKRFVLEHRENAVVIEINWRDNPWFGNEMRDEMEHQKNVNFDEYLHVWEGKCKVTLDGAVYAEQLRATLSATPPRITRVPYEPCVPVDTFWDLGKADLTAIWFAQAVGFEYRFIKYHEARGKELEYYLKYLAAQPFLYGTHWLPHDAKAKRLGTKRTIEEQMKDAKLRVKIVPKLSITDGISAARSIFPKCWFDEIECADGIQCLTHYRFEVDEDTKQYSSTPVHDDYSNGADAFRYAGVALKNPEHTGRTDRSAIRAALRAAMEPVPVNGWMR